MYLLDVYVTNASLNINRTFTYLSDYEVKRGVRVNVLFNKKKTMAFVYNVFSKEKSKEELESECGYKLNYILNVVDEKPIISEDLLELSLWLSKVTISPFISCLNVMLPKTLKIRHEYIKSRKETRIKKHDNADISMTKRQLEVYDELEDCMLYGDALKISPSIIKKLLDYGVIEKYEEDIKYNETVVDKTSFNKLNKEQSMAYEGIINSDKYVNLLYGVMGSGKTEVYLHLTRYYLTLNKQVLILVPEISLTPQMIKRVKQRFNNVAIYHSYLNDNEKYYEYNRVKNREVDVVVGTRSAVFLPFSNLGIIIIDEEHDHSYKQDNVPCYNAKMVAFKRAKDFDAKVVLASATPTLETYSRALRGDYGLFKLNNRINNTLPEIEVIDLQDEVKKGGSYIISEDLKNEIRNVLNSNEQSIIVLNRRGYSPVIKCADCGSVLMCNDCDTPLNYHKDENIMKCHICSRTYKVPAICPRCGSKKLLHYGFGTKRVVEYLEELFPDARIGRMDADSTSTKNGHEMILESFERHEIDILVGTQMISKGLDYPLVTLVGILNADSGLLHSDYNSTESTFDLLMQSSGRSGRSVKNGKVIIQAFNPEHYVVEAVKRQDYELFFNTEMNLRKKAMYPPYAHMIALYLKDSNLKRLEDSIIILDKLTDNTEFKKYRPMMLNRISGFSRYRILIKGKDLAKMLIEINNVVEKYLNNKNVSVIKVDVNPLYLE